jgi:hypothetical protein
MPSAKSRWATRRRPKNCEDKVTDLSALLATHGAEVAHVDDTAYLTLSAVYACETGKEPQFYCIERDWPATPAARLAALLRTNADLHAERDQQAAQIAQLTQRLATLEQHLKESGAVDPGPCPECGKTGWKNAQSLVMHRQRVHSGMQAPPRTQLDDTQGWRCAAKGCSGAFTRSLTDPDFCTHHAAPHTNGHLAATHLEAQDV